MFHPIPPFIGTPHLKRGLHSRELKHSLFIVCKNATERAFCMQLDLLVKCIWWNFEMNEAVQNSGYAFCLTN